jgi:predicted DNA binding protein
MREAFVTVKGPCSWMRQLVEKFGAEVHLLSTVQTDSGGIRDLAEIITKEELVDAVIQNLENNSMLSEVDISLVDKGKIVAAITLPDCANCRIVASSECFIMSGKTDEDGSIEWRLIVTSGDHLKNMIDKLQSNGCEVKLKKIASVNMDEFLTEREEEILYIAYKKGYFDYPKKVGIRELSKIFEISPSTLSESLRRGQRKIMEKYIEGHSHSHKTPFTTI